MSATHSLPTVGADGAERRGVTDTPSPRSKPVMQPWLRAQSINVTRHATALRPFANGEFGTGAAAPSWGHVKAVNELMVSLRNDLLRLTGQVKEAAHQAARQPSTANLQRVLMTKEHAHTRVRSIERVWDFYFELFGQRQSRFAPWLLACDRVALDCYQVAFMHVGKAKSIPAPAPFSYMRTGFGPATFRRRIPLRRLGLLLNPFPLIQLPYHRLVNPWTLGAVLHEVSHNLQNDLGLARVVPEAMARRLTSAGHPRSVVSTWLRWNRELFADLAGLLLGGPAIVGSLFDVIGRAPDTVLTYDPQEAHPTPYLRAHLSLELLRRMGFRQEAERYGRLWARLYPDPRAGTIPRSLLETLPRAVPLVVDTVCFTPLDALGGKRLAAVLPFGSKEQEIIQQAAERLAAGNDPGIVPERFLIAAARCALDQRLARPGVVMRHFYEALGRR
ncbi:MAG: hypothetical protein ACRD0K_10000 [Egibacteraceae bacterium]